MLPVRSGALSAPAQPLGAADATPLQYGMVNVSKVARESERSWTSTRTDRVAGAVLGHSAPAAVQSPISCALPPVPFGVGVALSSSVMNVTGTLTCRPPV